MKTSLSTKGQIVLPGPIRKKLDLRPGDSLDARIEKDRIILIPRRVRPRKSRIVDDPITGLPVLSAGPHAPLLTSAEVDEILTEFP